MSLVDTTTTTTITTTTGRTFLGQGYAEEAFVFAGHAPKEEEKKNGRERNRNYNVV